MERSLCFVKNRVSGTTQHNCAGAGQRASRKLDQTLLANCDLFNQLACTQFDFVWLLKGRHNVTTEYKRQPLNAIKVCVFNGRNTLIGKVLFRQIVNELSVHKQIALMCQDFFTLGKHAVSLCFFNGSHTRNIIDTHGCTKDFDLVCIHCSIGNQYAWVFNALWLTNTKAFLEQETVDQKRIGQLCSRLFDDVNRTQICRSLESQHCIDGQSCKLLLVGVENF
mmetsp:Transcript_10746/g.16101  ORF Transcript_10746/g.16101 Transcript_10746/m.16101 type:complete len:223 (-) Transcript_10746:1819-2487(-)